MDINTLAITENLVKLGTKDLAGEQYTSALEKFAPQGSLYTHEFLTKNFIAVSEAAKELVSMTNRLANYNCNVLILGEQGTGKELIASALRGSRRGQFVTLNCAELSDGLSLTQLFGHEKGAFTGATESRMGLVRQAQDGVMFLDEVADLDYKVQTAILRLTEYRTFRPVGALIEQTTNCRFVAATNKALDNSEIFRSDLYTRLGVVVLRTQPFHTLMDTEKLAFVAALAPDIKADAFFDTIIHNKWPGNIRQLKNFITKIRIFGLDVAIKLGV